VPAAADGWGKPASFQLVEDDGPLALDEAEWSALVEQFHAQVRRLAALPDTHPSAKGDGAADVLHRE
jgi:hypothetical protein